jgi:hypothetical protein
MPIATGTAALIAGGLGAGASLYGANKQSKNQKATDASNRAAIQESDLNSWRGYLMQRGLNPSGVTTFGQIPTNAQAVNTRLPLYATVSRPATSLAGTTGGRVRLSGTARG